MKYSFEEKWYKYLLNKCNSINPSIVYKSADGNGKEIVLSDVFVQQSVVQDAAYGIGKSRLTETGEECEKYTIENLLSVKKPNRHLIIGTLGSGKTSLLNNIVARIAEYCLYGKETDSLIVAAFKDKYIAYMSLKDFSDNAKPLFESFDLDKWVRNRLERVCNISEKKEIEEYFTDILNNGMVLIVDGLDEVEVEDRKELLKVLNSFSENSDNVVIATIRKEVLIEDSWLSDISDYQQITLSEFNWEQIKEYICKWKKHVGNVRDDNMKEIDVIIKTISANCYLKELAANPLFLTLMMLISEKEGEFPKSRTHVYEEAVKLIIGRWNKKSFGSDTEISRIREALECAAFNGMENLISQSKQSGDISAFITDSFARMFPNSNVEKYLKNVSEKTGIIVRKENKKYSFALRSFMEYLAGCFISSKLDTADFIEKQEDKLISWQEVIVFSVTKMAIERPGMAIAILYKLVKSDYPGIEKVKPEIVLIAGIITQELCSESDDKEVMIFSKRIKTWLRNYVCDSDIQYRLRFEMGNVLGRLGDDRDGVGIKKIAEKDYPDIKWIRIPRGWSKFGSPEGHINKVHSEYLDDYLISKYPITNRQFELFLANGYAEEKYWTKEGWAWVDGQDQVYFRSEESGRYTEERKKEYKRWLDSRGKEKRREPFWWNDYPWNIANRPVIGITWYEAVAYCNWLNVECREQLVGFLDEGEIDDAQICLPTLEEWEKAARGPECTKYPWGENLDYERMRCNVDRCELNETSAVGIFSEGKSEYEMYDAAGNVYEWISTGVLQVGKEKWDRQPEDLEEKYERLVKGGSWNMEYERAKAAYDEWDYPLIFDQNTGFRPIVRLKGSNDDNGVG